jgi:uncharacterized protein YdeI (YjbR/CyaY-like superfamily)
MTTDPRIDAYIAKAAPFARPILTHLRTLVHRTLPDAEETIKWGMPHFTVRARNVCGMAAFKAHCALTIHGEGRVGGEGMGQLGKVASLANLPPDELLAERLRDAAERIAMQGSASGKREKAPPRPEIPVPGDFAEALSEEPAAQATFDAFAPSHRREYLEWITDAKRKETRARRIAQSIEWLAEGKKRNWKYEKC